MMDTGEGEDAAPGDFDAGEQVAETIAHQRESYREEAEKDALEEGVEVYSAEVHSEEAGKEVHDEEPYNSAPLSIASFAAAGVHREEADEEVHDEDAFESGSEVYGEEVHDGDVAKDALESGSEVYGEEVHDEEATKDVLETGSEVYGEEVHDGDAAKDALESGSEVYGEEVHDEEATKDVLETCSEVYGEEVHDGDAAKDALESGSEVYGEEEKGEEADSEEVDASYNSWEQMEEVDDYAVCDQENSENYGASKHLEDEEGYEELEGREDLWATEESSKAKELGPEDELQIIDSDVREVLNVLLFTLEQSENGGGFPKAMTDGASVERPDAVERPMHASSEQMSTNPRAVQAVLGGQPALDDDDDDVAELSEDEDLIQISSDDEEYSIEDPDRHDVNPMPEDVQEEKEVRPEAVERPMLAGQDVFPPRKAFDSFVFGGVPDDDESVATPESFGSYEKIRGRIPGKEHHHTKNKKKNHSVLQQEKQYSNPSKRISPKVSPLQKPKTKQPKKPSPKGGFSKITVIQKGRPEGVVRPLLISKHVFPSREALDSQDKVSIIQLPDSREASSQASSLFVETPRSKATLPVKQGLPLDDDIFGKKRRRRKKKKKKKETVQSSTKSSDCHLPQLVGAANSKPRFRPFR